MLKCKIFRAVQLEMLLLKDGRSLEVVGGVRLRAYRMVENGSKVWVGVQGGRCRKLGEEHAQRWGRVKNDPFVQGTQYRSVRPEKGVPEYIWWQLKTFQKGNLESHQEGLKQKPRVWTLFFRCVKPLKVFEQGRSIIKVAEICLFVCFCGAREEICFEVCIEWWRNWK